MPNIRNVTSITASTTVLILSNQHMCLTHSLYLAVQTFTALLHYVESQSGGVFHSTLLFVLHCLGNIIWFTFPWTKTHYPFIAISASKCTIPGKNSEDLYSQVWEKNEQKQWHICHYNQLHHFLAHLTMSSGLILHSLALINFNDAELGP